MKVYHGSYTKIEEIELAKCLPHTTGDLPSVLLRGGASGGVARPKVCGDFHLLWLAASGGLYSAVTDFKKIKIV